MEAITLITPTKRISDIGFINSPVGKWTVEKNDGVMLDGNISLFNNDISMPKKQLFLELNEGHKSGTKPKY